MSDLDASLDAATATAAAAGAGGRRSGPLLSIAPSPTVPPRGFVRDVYEHTWTIARPRADVWRWLCDPATFTDGQIPPFRVEFLTNPVGETGFHEGVYNSHVGPLMCFAGVLGEIRHEEYRDLQYTYGSYAISHALFRPVRLQFWLDDDPTATADPGDGGARCVLHLRLDTDVRAGRAVGVWQRMMGVF
ncbi:MAG: hypothetical protein AAFP84_14760, partial [Actinomycetota bacterium]